MSICSMTAFAQRHMDTSWGSASWELRSVNHRYLEPSFKLPESWRALEPALRERIRQSLKRGKLECSLKLQLNSQQALQLNRELAQQVLDSAHALRADIAHAAPINVLEVLRWPGVMESGQVDGDTVGKDLLEAFDTALQDHIANRQREGAALASLIEQRLDNIAEIVAEVRRFMPDVIRQQRDKLQQRIDEMRVELDPQRLEQEVALIAQKADVDEELDRLDTHVTEVRRVLQSGGPVGRRLDFLMQELNREANTLSSKAVVADSTQAAVELKVLIEQMREQIQNIE